jgi:two-component system sensor histidine kinase TctE
MRNQNEKKTPSIRRRLFAMLLLPAVAILTVGTLSDYFTAIAPFRDAYDQALIDSALVIAAHVQPDGEGRPALSLPPDAVSILRTDSIDSIYFKVSGAEGEFIAGDEDLPDVHQVMFNPSRGDAIYRDEPIRLVSYRTFGSAGSVNVSVGETLRKRDQTRSRILFNALAVDIGELAIVLAVIWLGVRLALGPLRSVEEQIAKRSPRDLAPLPKDSVPVEIRSMVRALNRLFSAVRDTGAAQRRFLESAAHQLRTPLTGIQAQLELLVAESEPPQKERLALMLDAARRLTHMTQQLLTLARSDEAASLNWEFAEVDLTSIVEATVADRISAADAAGVDLGAQIQPASVKGVAWLLSEALGNLANNAIAHTPPGGSVTIQCGVSEGACFLEVIDTGVGIPAKERERVLERFFRGSNARGVGTGLGLAIVRDVAQLHSAVLTLNEGPEGKGTSVRITFPD